jgi:TRAP-type C4-dicarboxylate transport system permease large subunit
MLVEATVMMTLVTFGGMTPPVGVSICAVCGIQCCSHKDYTVKSLPVVAAVLIAVVIVILFPQVVLLLPTMLM